ncbi:ABC transporter ATPase [Oenococcus alcoholitolerans]|uniref:ABC transporter ATPase n=2 Tax=Oenococcus alcoholitolerans TaxID=931074 RepID=A0ABR4XSQ3_9LACO|nr:ABC transporter ATPase [Oenococcus alcoholitolerans]
MQNKDLLLSIRKLSMEFDGRVLFKDLDLDLKKGDFLCLLGENGTGKTTLIRNILGLLKPSSGKIYFSSKSLEARNIGYVPQFRNIEKNYPLSIENFVALKANESPFPWLSRKEKNKVAQALKRTGLWQKRKQRLGRASGGEKQRAYLAQAILDDPQLLILDESTANLDQKAKFEVLDLVSDLNENFKTTIIFISHDWELVKKYGKHYLELTGTDYKTGRADQVKVYQGDRNV